MVILDMVVYGFESLREEDASALSPALSPKGGEGAIKITIKITIKRPAVHASFELIRLNSISAYCFWNALNRNGKIPSNNTPPNNKTNHTPYGCRAIVSGLAEGYVSDQTRTFFIGHADAVVDFEVNDGDFGHGGLWI